MWSSKESHRFGLVYKAYCMRIAYTQSLSLLVFEQLMASGGGKVSFLSRKLATQPHWSEWSHAQKYMASTNLELGVIKKNNKTKDMKLGVKSGGGSGRRQREELG